MKADLRKVIEEWKNNKDFGINQVKEKESHGNYLLQISSSIKFNFEGNSEIITTFKLMQTIAQEDNYKYSSKGDIASFKKLCESVEQELLLKCSDKLRTLTTGIFDKE